MFRDLRLGMFGVLAVSVMSPLPHAAAAGCVPGLTTDNFTFNTCIGTDALSANPTDLGIENTAMGYQALQFNTSGRYNAAFGVYSLQSNRSGQSNTALGSAALPHNTTGNDNAAVGNAALFSNQTGTGNAATGSSALYSNKNGSFNSAFGTASLGQNIRGGSNTAVGHSALYETKNGNNNTALGMNAMYYGETGSNNVAVGKDAAYYITGNNNIAIGYQAGYDWRTGNNNIAIASPGSANDMRTIRIGVQGRQQTTIIAGIRGVNVTGGVPVLINANGQLGIATSSRKFKEDIRPIGDASSALLKLQPVSFRYKEADGAGQKPLQYGLIAEEVDEVMPELVVRNSEGGIETVAYQMLPSLLLNEYQKQNRELLNTREKLAEMEVQLTAMRLTLSRLASPTPAMTNKFASVAKDHSRGPTAE